MAEDFNRDMWEHGHASPWRKPMAEPTKEQINRAIDVAKGMHAEDAFRTAAPYLQLPWKEPTVEETASLVNEIGPTIHRVIMEFVRRRNAAL
jgi:hypothetical protein